MTLVLEVITKKIAQLRPELPLFTIHDSIITTRGSEGVVQEIMLGELERAINLRPQLRIEYWHPGNLSTIYSMVSGNKVEAA
jgi:hypothetical protein